MAEIHELENNIIEIIKDLKGICQTAGLSNSPAEEVVMTSTFLYKFLNDKFMWNLDNFSKEIGLDKESILNNEGESLSAFYDTYSRDVAFTKEDTIEYLIKQIELPKFYEKFDNALEHISNNPKNEAFLIATAEGEKKPLFTRITENVESSKRNNFAKGLFTAITNKKFDFGEAFEQNFDFYSTIFEYLIKDYNVASGVYAEYFTPQAVSKIIAKILVNMSPVKDTLYEISDPAAGSGSLILHLAHELGRGSFGNKAIVYTQDVSQKSTRFLRLNMMLNGLVESLDNIVEGDTLLSPAHFNEKGVPSSGLKKYDYEIMNPPFKVDFSSTRDMIESTWNATDRFKQGVPSIPEKKKESMPIYLLFIQHLLYTLKDDGKGAIVVPTGFITSQQRIEKAIRQKITEEGWLKGVISMPSNIFANTGTNVSILFIDKACNRETNKEVILIDASKLGTKVKEGKNQKTVLSPEEIKKIEDTFINMEEIEDFSVKASFEEIEKKNCSWSAGQYFDVKIEYVELAPEEFKKKIEGYKVALNQLFSEGKELEDEIKKQLEGLKYEG